MIAFDASLAAQIVVGARPMQPGKALKLAEAVTTHLLLQLSNTLYGVGGKFRRKM